jgi:hypothetical protein
MKIILPFISLVLVSSKKLLIDSINWYAFFNHDTLNEGINLDILFNDGSYINCDLNENVKVFSDQVTKIIQKNNKIIPLKCEDNIKAYTNLYNNCTFSFFKNNRIIGNIIDNNNKLVYGIDYPTTLSVDISQLRNDTTICGVKSNGINFNVNNVKVNNNLELWDTCYDSVNEGGKSLNIGIAIGSEAIKKNGGFCKVHDSIVSMIASTNSILSSQVNVNLIIHTLYMIHPKDKKNQFNNKKCKKTIDQQFNDFTTFNPQFKIAQEGFWHLIDDCFGISPGNTIGIGYVGGACKNSQNTAITYKRRGDSWGNTWLIFAHECGHLLGMYHSFEEGAGKTGGIMDYGKPYLNGEIQFNRKYRENELCGLLNNLIHTKCPHFYDTYPICGNGFIETGEECECPKKTLSCDCCKDCKIIGQCFGDHVCCTNDCKYKNTDDIFCMNENNKESYCSYGKCVESICELFNYEFCGLHSDGCKVKCIRNGKCDTLNNLSGIGNNNAINNVKDGTTCNKGICKNGICLS